jgi:hypothetical protein
MRSVCKLAISAQILVSWLLDVIPSNQHIPESQAEPTQKVKQLSDRTIMGGATLLHVILHKYK